MGWAKYMEDNLEIIESRRNNIYPELYNKRIEETLPQQSSIKIKAKPKTSPYQRRPLICIGCGRQFYLSPGTLEYYEKHHFKLPKKCKSCRETKSIRPLIRLSF